MHISIIGAGTLGSALARRFVNVGHHVFIGSRDSTRGKQLAAELGVQDGGTYQQAIIGADALVISVRWWGVNEALKQLETIKGQILIDVTNPYLDDTYTRKQQFELSSGAEEIQRHLPQAHVVKTWNHVSASAIELAPSLVNTPTVLFVCGNNALAKRTVSTLAEQIGWNPVDAGPLSSARYLERMG